MTARKYKLRGGLLASTVVLALVLAACGGDDDDDAGGATTTAASGGATTTAAAGGGAAEDFSGKTINVSGSEVGSEAEGFEAGAVPFEEATGADVKLTGTRDFETQIRVALESGQLPDIALFPQPGAMTAFVDAATALPDDLVATLKENYDSVWTDLVTFDGKVVGVPLKADVKSLVWYSPKTFSDNGYEIPQTWDELIALQNQMKDDGITPWCIGIESGAATGWPFTDWMEDLMLRINGPEVYDQWVNHEIPFNDPKVKAVAEQIGEIWFDDANVLGGRSAIASTGFGASPVPVLDGQCGLHRQGNFAAANFVSANPDVKFGPDGDVDAFYLPTISDEFGKVMLSGGNYAVAFNDKPETLAFMKAMADPSWANARIQSNVGGFLSPNKKHDRSLYSSPLDAGFAELLVTSDVVRFDGSDLMPGEVGAGSFWKEGTNYVSGTIDVDEFLDNVEASWPAS